MADTKYIEKLIRQAEEWEPADTYAEQTKMIVSPWLYEQILAEYLRQSWRNRLRYWLRGLWWRLWGYRKSMFYKASGMKDTGGDNA